MNNQNYPYTHTHTHTHTHRHTSHDIISMYITIKVYISIQESKFYNAFWGTVTLSTVIFRQTGCEKNTFHWYTGSGGPYPNSATVP